MLNVNRIRVIRVGGSAGSFPQLASRSPGGFMEFAGAECEPAPTTNTTYGDLHVYHLLDDPTRQEVETFTNADWFLAIHPLSCGMYF
jgi:hypothetical protein